MTFFTSLTFIFTPCVYKHDDGSEATLRVEHVTFLVTFLTCDGPLFQHNVQGLHVPTWQYGCKDARNKGNSVLDSLTVLTTLLTKLLFNAISIDSAT
jgi:hypothetical protein